MGDETQPLDSSKDWDSDTQRKFWNSWDTQHLQETTIGREGQRRGQVVMGLLRSLSLKRPRILEVGCGNGWLAQQLVAIGPLTGVDIADAAIEEARRGVPGAQFHAGDVRDLNLPSGSFDVIVTLETFSHVPDQRQFIEVLASLLSDRGHLILTTQNRSVYMRNSHIRPPAEGQLRHWVTRRELHALLSPYFVCLRSFTIEPSGDCGILRIVNSHKLNAALSRLVSKAVITRMKEYSGFGQTLVAVAQKRP
jgi:SAM-dependent methyltransferase